MRCPAPRSLCATLLLSAHLIGCTEWHVAETSPQALVDAKRPAGVRVTLRDDVMVDTVHSSLPGDPPLGGHPGPSTELAGAEIVVGRPSIIGDSLVGQIRGRSSSIAVADIATVATPRASAVKTLMLVGGIGLLIAAVTALGNALDGIGGVGIDVGIGF